MKKIVLIILSFFSVVLSAQDLSIRQRIQNLPVLDAPHSAIKYQGSIDKKGGNADWDWWLYQDENNEWVLLDVDGTGVIENLVQHRYPTAPDADIRFYLDDQKTPLYSIKLSEIGNKYPFVEPLAGAYVGPLDGGRGPIRVVRSFVPIPFQKHCKVTSSRKLFGNDLAKGESGWGHIIYHTYDSIPYTYYETKESDRSILKTKGYQVAEGKDFTKNLVQIMPGTSVEVFKGEEPGLITALRMFCQEVDEKLLRNLWVRITFDDHSQSDILSTAGAFFGNTFAYNTTEYLFMGVNHQGLLYNTFPMPYWKNVSVSLENRGTTALNIMGISVSVAENIYNQSECGYFRNAPFYTRRHTEGADSRIAEVKGYGKMVAAHVSCWAEKANVISCEGDVRVYIDGLKTPSVQSDGSESYVCYGWGFPTPSENHAFGGYDGKVDNPWSMTRLLINDSYPFYESLVFDIESGEHNNQYLEHEGTVFFYSKDCQLLETCYTCKKKANLSSGESLDFNVKIDPTNKGLRLVRTANQTQGRQEAEVYVDGRKIANINWYYADSNPYNPMLQDQFEIPEIYTQGKKQVKISIKAVTTFSVETIEVKSYINN